MRSVLKLLNAGEVTQGVRGRWESANKWRGLMPRWSSWSKELLDPHRMGNSGHGLWDTSWAEATSLHHRPGIKYVKAGMETWNGGNGEPTRAAAF